MLRPHGYVTVADPDARTLKRDTIACCHCSAHIVVKPLTASTTYLVFNPATWLWEEHPGAGCWHCGKPVCLACHATGRCRPLEQALAQWEHEGAHLLNVGG